MMEPADIMKVAEMFQVLKRCETDRVNRMKRPETMERGGMIDGDTM